MKPAQLLQSAVERLTEWEKESETESLTDENYDDVMNKAAMSVILYALDHIDNREYPPVRHGLSMAYGIMGTK
jgi:hypothetical protein